VADTPITFDQNSMEMEDSVNEKRTVYTREEKRANRKNKWFERDPKKEQRKRSLLD
jgi:hypothetical protein